MKKLLFALLLSVLFVPCFAQEKGRMFVAPWRETYFNFPSQTLGDAYTLTVFLPEEAVPLKKPYPVVYFLGLPRSEKEAAQLFARTNGVILLTVNLEEKDFRRLGDKLETFLMRDLIPYIDTNYYTARDKRILAVRGGAGAKALWPIVAKGNLTKRLFVQSPGDALAEWPTLSAPAAADTRVLVEGNQPELASAAEALARAGLLYGKGFALSYAPYETDFLSGLHIPYLLADEDAVRPTRLYARLGTTELPLRGGARVSLTAEAEFSNGWRFAAIPQTVRTSPPYLDWEPASGMLAVRAGAAAGTVKITPVVDNLLVTQKIMLKKQ